MSLLDNAMVTCTLLKIETVDDIDGGYKQNVSDDIQFDAAIVLSSASEKEKGEKTENVSLYTVTTRKHTTLHYHDVFRRDSDGKTFRVISNGDDKKTPDSAFLDMKQVTAEEWSVPK
ncbi:MAG: hypothetical protein J6Q94_01160 [Clostridia bacterium]|nr:hypothetical protein [Clostridia bacterium]